MQTMIKKLTGDVLCGRMSQGTKPQREATEKHVEQRDLFCLSLLHSLDYELTLEMSAR
jgi:hypothetical protein